MTRRLGACTTLLVLALLALPMLLAQPASSIRARRPRASSNDPSSSRTLRTMRLTGGLLPRARGWSRVNVEEDDDGDDDAHMPGARGWKRGRTKRALLLGLITYVCLFITLTLSHRAQTYFIYLHWLRPPAFLYPLDDLRPYRLASSGRVVRQGHLRGWHLLPPGPPFTDGAAHTFDEQLRARAQRVVLFLHGNSGTRACPSKRVTAVRLLAAQLRAHVLTFDYSGFGDSGGRPSETQLNRDVRAMYAWLRERTAPDTDVVVYGQSLGSFAAVDLAVHVSERATTAGERVAGLTVVLDAAPASLVDAAMTHPVGKLFRVLPKMETFFRWVLKESLDSAGKVGRVRVPLLIMHGEADGMIALEQGRKLYDAAVAGGNSDAEFVPFPNCGHNDVNASPQYLNVLNGFLEKHLRVPIPPQI